MKKNTIIWILVICFILTGCFSLIYYIQPTLKQGIAIKKDIKSIVFERLEIANTPQQREKGLMNRVSLCKSCAMLFIFDSSEVLNFWMKNTQIPLDIVFVDEKNSIIKIHQNTSPLQTSPTYSSQSKAKYVIETNAYFIKENNINVGDTLDMSKLIASGVAFDNSSK
jgi:uncharacterized protein